MEWNWPDGRSFAFFLSFDLEADAPEVREKPRDYVSLTRGRAGLGAMGRLLDIMNACDIKTTFYICTWLTEQHPGIITRIADQGHEIGCHGHLHEHLIHLSADQERGVFEQSDALCKSFFGGPAPGFRAPYWRMNAGTLKLISQFGFKYDSSMMDSNAPYILVNDPDRPAVVELPVSTYLDDYPHYEVNRRSAGEFKTLVLEEVDAVKEQGGYMSLSMHPKMEVLDSRLKALQAIIEHVQASNGYISTGNELAEAVIENLT